MGFADVTAGMLNCSHIVFPIFFQFNQFPVSHLSLYLYNHNDYVHNYIDEQLWKWKDELWNNYIMSFYWKSLAAHKKKNKKKNHMVAYNVTRKSVVLFLPENKAQHLGHVPTTKLTTSPSLWVTGTQHEKILNTQDTHWTVWKIHTADVYWKCSLSPENVRDLVIEYDGQLCW